MVWRGTLPLLTGALVLVSSLGNAEASAAPRFDVDACSWSATHVVVATEGPSIDGRLAVIESWVGPLPPGASIHLPTLSAFSPPEHRMAREGVCVSGTRMVLFLRRGEGPEAWESPSFAGDVGEGDVCWIEGGEMYAVDGQRNRFGTSIRRMSMTEPALRTQVLRVRMARVALDEIRAREVVEQRLAGAAKYVGEKSHPVQEAAFDIIRDCGRVAVPFLLSLVGPDSDWRTEWRACWALGAVADASAVGPLVALLEAELVFWQGAQRTLPEGWWRPGGLEWREWHSYDVRFDRVASIIDRALQGIAAPGYEDIVRRTRALWTSAPALRDAYDGQVVDACDAALRALEHERRATE